MTSTNRRETIQLLGYPDEPLGKGSYGSVYRCMNDRGAILAIKCIKTSKDTGIQSLVEICIMSSLKHPHLNSALYVNISDDMMYIAQELAISDLQKWTKGKCATDDTLLSWTKSLVLAVDHLHKNHMVHGDIKSSNVLLFPNGTIRLCDFTLSILLKRKSYDHRVCTCTHRPLEVWLGHSWDTSIDMWALGCTLYEIGFGSLLIPNQEKEPNDTESGTVKDRFINSLLYWGRHGPVEHDMTYLDDIKREEYCQLEYRKFSLSEKFDRDKLVCKIILSLLHLDSTKRATVRDVMKDLDLDDPSGENGHTEFQPIQKKHTKSSQDPTLMNYLSSRTSDDTLISSCLSIYHEARDIFGKKETKLEACLLIASKLAYIPYQMNNKNVAETLKMETLICSTLSFHLIDTIPIP